MGKKLADSVKDLEKKRRRVGISRYALCKTAGIRLSTYHRWMHGSVPKDEKMAVVLQALEATQPA